MRHFILVLFLLSVLTFACSPGHWGKSGALMDDVETFITDRPDSALAMLDRVDPTTLTNRALQARYSLLRVMAMYKNYKDITTPGLLDDAVRYYSRYGSADEKLKTFYYQGCILQAQKDLNSAAISFFQAEQYASQATDSHTVALLYEAFANVYNKVFNTQKEQEYIEKGLALLKQSKDPMYGSFLGNMAQVYHSKKDWNRADSLYQEAITFSEAYPRALAGYMSNYARMKLLQPEKDPTGAMDLLNRKKDISGGGLTPKEVGAYAYASELLGDKNTADALVARLQAVPESSRGAVLPWLYRIALSRGDLSRALTLLQDMRIGEDAQINAVLEDSVSSALQRYNEQLVEKEKNRRGLLVMSFSILLLLSLLLATIAILRRRNLELERDNLLRIQASLEKELEETMQEREEEVSRRSEEQERENFDMETRLCQLKEDFHRERVARFRQAGNLGSIVLLKEKNRISDADGWRLLRRELVYIHHLDGDGAELIRRMDRELDGMISRLRKDLNLVGKPREVLFLCCCILDMDAQVLADLAGKDSLDAVYKKRSRLKAKILALGNPEYDVLFKKYDRTRE